MNDTLRRALADARLGEVEVSSALGVDTKTVQRWVAGRLPQRRHRWALADLVGQHELDLWPALTRGHVAQCPEIMATYAVVEVVVDMERQYGRTYAEMFPNRNTHPAPSLDRRWFFRLSMNAKLKLLRAEQESLLSRLTETGALFADVRFQNGWEGSADPADKRLKELGVAGMTSVPLSAEEAGEIVWTPVGASGPPELDWPGFLKWVEQYLTSERTRDVREKLLFSGATERHVFVGASFTSPWVAFNVLRAQRSSLPDTAPTLPDEITHLWIWTAPVFGRCLAWWPDRGWFEPRYSWAAD